MQSISGQNPAGQRFSPRRTEVYRIRVIHGHNGGTALRELTRTYETHPKVKRMIAAEGDTTFILREI